MTELVVTGDTAEVVAYRLLQTIASAEKKSLAIGNANGNQATADRNWILDTYAECLQATKGNRKVDTKTLLDVM